MDLETQFIEFREFYKTQHPASVPHESMYAAVSETPQWLPYAVLAMFISVSLLSGVHTINTVYRLMETTDALLPGWVYGVVSVGSFVGVELALMLSAYLIVREAVMGWIVLGVTFLFAMSANLYSVSRALANATTATTPLFTIGTVQVTGELIVAVIMGIGAPLMALMAGKMYVNINRSERRATLTSRAQYQEALLKFDKEVVDAFHKAYGKQRRVSDMSVNVSNAPLSRLSNGQMDMSNGQKALPAKSSSGHSRQPDATKRTVEFFRANRDAMQLPVRQLEEVIGAKRSTINAVRKAIQDGSISLDGQVDTPDTGQ